MNRIDVNIMGRDREDLVNVKKDYFEVVYAEF